MNVVVFRLSPFDSFDRQKTIFPRRHAKGREEHLSLMREVSRRARMRGNKQGTHEGTHKGCPYRLNFSEP